MRLFFYCGNDLHEGLDIGRRHAARDCRLEIAEVTVHATRNLTPNCGWRNDECATIRQAYLPGDESALSQSIQDAGERRAFVRQALM